jgi:predicted metalloendopeptidase
MPDFSAHAPGLDWAAFFTAAGLDKQTSFIAWHPTAITGLAALVKGEPLESWKDWLVAQTLAEDADYLPKAFVDESFAFHDTALRGTPQIEERWKRGVRLTGDALGGAVGALYAQRYFPADRKHVIEGMVDGIKAAFARRIDGLTWMSPATKVTAKAKLGTLVVGVGYPDAPPDYTGLEIVRGEALGNVERVRKAEYQRRLAQLGKAPDRKEWAMSAQMVNAVNLPVRNALNFPAAILEPPFYVADATPAVNYAAIGAVIGHEISHSFDDQGSLFDATGRVASWWTPDDFAHFEASGAALAAQFDAYHPFPDVAVNGKQTLGENIADLAGLAVAHDAWVASLGGAPAPVVDGLTGEQQFFLSFAQVWESKFREPALRARLVSDGHAPGMYRALTVRNFDAWYAAFGVKAADPLYLAPSARVSVW